MSSVTSKENTTSESSHSVKAAGSNAAAVKAPSQSQPKVSLSATKSSGSGDKLPATNSKSGSGETAGSGSKSSLAGKPSQTPSSAGTGSSPAVDKKPSTAKETASSSQPLPNAPSQSATKAQSGSKTAVAPASSSSASSSPSSADAPQGPGADKPDQSPPPQTSNTGTNKKPSDPSGTQLNPSGAQPSPSGAQPSPSGAKPSPSGAQPSPSGAQPSPSGAQPSPSSAKPSPSGAKPSPSGAQPSPSGAKPSPSGAKPSPSGAQPSPSGAQPSPSGAQPSPSGAQPSPSSAKPSPSGAKPSASGAKPSPSGAQPSPSGAQPSPSGAQPSPSGAQPSPSGAQPSPSSAKPSPSGAKPSPSGAQPSPSGAKPSPSGAQPSPSGAQPSPSGAQPSPSGAQPSPSSAKPSPSGAQPSPSGAKPSPSGAKPSPSGAQPSPSGAKPSPSGAQPSPSGAKPSPSGVQPSQSGTKSDVTQSGSKVATPKTSNAQAGTPSDTGGERRASQIPSGNQLPQSASGARRSSLSKGSATARTASSAADGSRRLSGTADGRVLTIKTSTDNAAGSASETVDVSSLASRVSQGAAQETLKNIIDSSSAVKDGTNTIPVPAAAPSGAEGVDVKTEDIGGAITDSSGAVPPAPLEPLLSGTEHGQPTGSSQAASSSQPSTSRGNVGAEEGVSPDSEVRRSSTYLYNDWDRTLYEKDGRPQPGEPHWSRTNSSYSRRASAASPSSRRRRSGRSRRSSSPGRFASPATQRRFDMERCKRDTYDQFGRRIVYHHCFIEPQFFLQGRGIALTDVRKGSIVAGKDVYAGFSEAKVNPPSEYQLAEQMMGRKKKRRKKRKTKRRRSSPRRKKPRSERRQIEEEWQRLEEASEKLEEDKKRLLHMRMRLEELENWWDTEGLLILQRDEIRMQEESIINVAIEEECLRISAEKDRLRLEWNFLRERMERQDQEDDRIREQTQTLEEMQHELSLNEQKEKRKTEELERKFAAERRMMEEDRRNLVHHCIKAEGLSDPVPLGNLSQLSATWTDSSIDNVHKAATKDDSGNIYELLCENTLPDGSCRRMTGVGDIEENSREAEDTCSSPPAETPGELTEDHLADRHRDSILPNPVSGHAPVQCKATDSQEANPIQVNSKGDGFVAGKGLADWQEGGKPRNSVSVPLPRRPITARGRAAGLSEGQIGGFANKSGIELNQLATAGQHPHPKSESDVGGIDGNKPREDRRMSALPEFHFDDKVFIVHADDQKKKKIDISPSLNGSKQNTTPKPCSASGTTAAVGASCSQAAPGKGRRTVEAQGLAPIQEVKSEIESRAVSQAPKSEGSKNDLNQESRTFKSGGSTTSQTKVIQSESSNQAKAASSSSRSQRNLSTQSVSPSSQRAVIQSESSNQAKTASSSSGSQRKLSTQSVSPSSQKDVIQSESSNQAKTASSSSGSQRKLSTQSISPSSQKDVAVSDSHSKEGSAVTPPEAASDPKSNEVLQDRSTDDKNGTENSAETTNASSVEGAQIKKSRESKIESSTSQATGGASSSPPTEPDSDSSRPSSGALSPDGTRRSSLKQGENTSRRVSFVEGAQVKELPPSAGDGKPEASESDAGQENVAEAKDASEEQGDLPAEGRVTNVEGPDPETVPVEAVEDKETQ